LGKVDEINRLKDNMKKTKDFLIDELKYPDVTVEDFYDQGIYLQQGAKKLNDIGTFGDIGHFRRCGNRNYFS
jgi:hypothetical protein